MSSLSQIAELLDVAAPTGAGNVPVTGIATLVEAGESDLSFLGNDRFLSQFLETGAGAVIVQKRVKLPAGNSKPVLLVDDADLAAAKVAQHFAPPIWRPPVGIDPSAHVAPTAAIG